MSRPGDKGSEGGRYPNKCCASRDLGSQEIPHPGRHPEKPQKPIGCLKWSSDVQDRLQERYLTVEGEGWSFGSAQTLPQLSAAHMGAQVGLTVPDSA